MRKSVEITIPYRRKGLDSEKYVVIDFISNKCIKLYTELDEIKNRVLLNSYEAMEIKNKLSKTDNKLEIAKLQKRVNELDESIKKVSDGDFYKKRMHLIHKILINNSVSDEDLLDPDFWDECVEPSDMVTFLDVAIRKDESSSKKKSPDRMTSSMKTA